MSNRRKLRPQTAGRSVLDNMTGRRVPGGCPDCDAYQVITQEHPGVYVLTVHHDDTCPSYRTMTR